MSTPHLIMLGIVSAVGVSSWKNPTALALVMAWMFGELVVLITGDSLPIRYYLAPDILVMAVIFAKPECNPCPRYLNTWHQLKCLFMERSVPDRFILLIFMVEWLIYVAPINPYDKWWVLYGLTISQFIASGIEFLLKIRHARAIIIPDKKPSGLKYAVAWRLSGYG